LERLGTTVVDALVVVDGLEAEREKKENIYLIE
jgi:hypothetical protein